MSAQDPSALATYEGFLINNYAVFATVALVSYEHLVTFQHEIDFLWRRKWSSATWIFLTNRYLLLVRVIFQSSPTNPQICGNVRLMNFLSLLTNSTLQALPASLFSVLRVFALLDKNHWALALSGFLLLQTIFFTVAEAYSTVEETWFYVDDPLLGPICSANGFNIPPNVVFSLIVSLAVVRITSELIVLAVTLFRTFHQVRQASSLGMRLGLSETLLRDGSIFLVLTLAEDSITTALQFSASLNALPASNALAPISNILPYIFLSRFIINLRQIDAPRSGSSLNVHASRFSIPNFHMPTMDDIIGNLGEPLDFEAHLEDDQNGRKHPDNSVIVDENCASSMNATSIVLGSQSSTRDDSRERA